MRNEGTERYTEMSRLARMGTAGVVKENRFQSEAEICKCGQREVDKRSVVIVERRDVAMGRSGRRCKRSRSEGGRES